MRDVGPLSREELEQFQMRHGAKVDGKFGNQSMGVVLEIENDLTRVFKHNGEITTALRKSEQSYSALHQRFDVLKNSYDQMKAELEAEKNKTWWDKLFQ